MFKYSKLLIASIASLTSVEATNPGAAVTLTESGTNKGKDVLLPIFFQYLQDIHVDEVDFDGGNLKNIDVHIPQPDTNAVDIKFDTQPNGVELTCSQAEVQATADFHFTYLFISVDGKADIKVNKATLDVEIDASTQPGTPSTGLAPKVTATKMNIGVNPDDIDIQLTGGLVAKIANVLIPLLKNSVIPSIITQVQQTATDMINNDIDKDLQIYGTQQEIPFLSGVTADYAQIGNGPEFVQQGDKQVFRMGVNGTFFDASDVEAPATEPVPFTFRDPKGKDTQVFLTDYTVNSAVGAGFLTGLDLDVTYLLDHFF